MKWITAPFKCRNTAELCRSDLIGVGIKVSEIFLSYDCYCLPWLPFTRAEYAIGVKIVSKYIWWFF